MKIVIWGYPLNSHTHSYIHSSFYKAFKHLGHDVYWFHDDEYPEDFNYDDCVFLTEGFADKNIPLRETSTYYVHVCVNPKKYLGKVKKLIDVRYLQESMDKLWEQQKQQADEMIEAAPDDAAKNDYKRLRRNIDHIFTNHSGGGSDGGNKANFNFFSCHCGSDSH